MQDALASVTASLQGSNARFRLCHTIPSAVYRNPRYDYARHGIDLYIRLRLPYSQHEVMSVYKTYTFPMKVPGNQGFVTELQNFPRFIVTHLGTGTVGELTELPRQELIESASVIWHGSDSCATKLLTDISDDVHKACKFTAREAAIEPSWLRLFEYEFVLSNLTDA